jgi:hypothetical protein
MANGRFSNGGVDTFDESKQFIGVRLQRGVPLLDRDWNEAEDVRRYQECSLRRSYIGDGAPGATDFQVVPAPVGADFDFVVSPGRAMVDGYDVWNPSALLYSSQPGASKLPAATVADSLQVFVAPSVQRVTSAEDRDLANTQDIDLETCVRDKLAWTVGVARAPEQAPAGSLLLATIRRPVNATHIDPGMIEDNRGPLLNLRAVTLANFALERRAVIAERRVAELEAGMAEVRRQLAKLFWSLQLSSTTGGLFYLWGDRATVSIQVVDGLGAPVVNCYLACSTTSGHLSPAAAVTDENGRAAISLLFVDTISKPEESELGILKNAVQKVKRATLANPGSVQYAMVQFEPQEIAMISRYSPSRSLQDLSSEIPSATIVRQPRPVVAHVTVHAKDAENGVVRGTGSIQVTWGEWVRDWSLTKIYEIAHANDVSVRVGDLMRSGVQAAAFDVNRVQDQITNLYEQVHLDTVTTLKNRLFTTPGVSDDVLARSGVLGQTIVQEATNAVGSMVNRAVNTELQNLAADPSVPSESKTSIVASQNKVLQHVASTGAGIAQRSRQLLNSYSPKV